MNKNRNSRISLLLGFAVAIGVMFALPSLGMGPNRPPPPDCSAGLVVPCLEWAVTSGNPPKNIHVQAFVVTAAGSGPNGAVGGEPVIGAVVSMSARQDGVEYAVVGGPTEAYGGLDGGVDCPGGPPAESITRDFCVNSAPTAFYDAVVLSVSKEGCGSWDGKTPPNGRDFTAKEKNK